MDFYHYGMDVYTHFQHIYAQTTCKVNFASDDPFNEYVTMLTNDLLTNDLHDLCNLRTEHFCHMNNTLTLLHYKKLCSYLVFLSYFLINILNQDAFT